MAERTAPHSEIVVGAQDNASPTFDQIRNSVEKMALAMKQSSDKANGAMKDMDAQTEASARATKSALSAISRAQTEAMRGLVEAGGYAYKSADGIEYLAKLRKADATAIQGQVAALRELEAVMSAASAKQREMASQQNFLANLTRETEGIGKTRAELVALQAAQLGVADKAAPLIAKLREQETQFGANGKSAKEMQAALRGVPAQITDIVVSLQGGQAPLTVLLQQGGQLRDMFGGVGVAARALGSAVLGMVNPLTVSLATVAGLGYAYSQGSKEADAFRLALVSTGSASGATVGQMQQMAASIDGVVGTQAKAAETLALFATQTVAGKASMEQYATAAIAWEQASGESVESVAKKFGSLKDAPLQGVLKLNESMNFLTESVYAQIKSLEEQGKTTEAAKVAQDALANALQDRSAEMVKNLGSIERGWKNVKHAVAETWDAIKAIGRVTPPEELLSASRSRVNVMQAEYDYKIQRGMSTGTLGERLEKEKGLLATLQAQVKANADSAQAEADRLTRVNARADADKNALKYLDDQAKMARQIAAERETIQRAYTGKTDAASQKAMAAEIEASEASIRNSYEKTKKVRESAATGESEVASIRAKIAEQTRYLKTMQETGAEYTKLTEGERLVIKINEELQTGLKGAARANKEKALAAAEALVVVEKQVGAEQALAKSNAESEAAYRKDLSAMAQRTDAMDAQAAQLEAANAVYGKGKIAIEEYNLQLEQERLKRLNALGLQGATTEELTREIEARQRLIAAMKQAEFKAASQKSTESLKQARAANGLVREEIGLIGMTEVERKKIIAARKAEIELAKELRAIDAMGIDESDKETLRIEARAKSRIDAETNASRAVLDVWQKTADDINRSLTDALLRGFESGKDFAKNLRDTIKNMFSTLVLRPIISAEMQPVSMAINGAVQGGGSAGSAMNLLSMGKDLYGAIQGGFATMTNSIAMYAQQGINFLTGAGPMSATSLPGAAAQGIGAAGSALAGVAGGIYGGRFVSGGYSAWGGSGNSAVNTGTAIGAAVGSIVPGIGTALGALVGGLLGGAVNRLFGHKLKDSGIEGDFGGATGFEGRQFEYYKGGVFRSDKTKYKDLDEETRAALADTFNTMRRGAKEMAGVLGLGTEAIDSFTAHVKVSLKGLSAEEADKRLKEEFDKLSESLASTTLGTDEYTRSGETAVQTLTRLSSSLVAVNYVFDHLGVTLLSASLASGDLASGLIDAMGGMEQFQSTLQGYYQSYYSQTEQLSNAARTMGKGFDELGVAMPRSRQELRGMITAALEAGESGQELAASLLNASANFDSFADSLMSLSGITTDTIKGIFSTILDEAGSAQEAEQMAADAFGVMIMDSMQNAMLSGLSDMVMNSLVAPMMESMLAGAVTGSTALASGGATAAAAMAQGGAYAGAANAGGGAAAADSMAQGGASAGASMASGGAAAGGVVGSFLDHAKVYLGNFTAVMSDPEVQAAMAELGKTFGSTAGSLYSFSGGGGGGAKSFNGGGGGGGGAASEADKLAESMKKLGEVIGDEIKRLTGAMDDFDPKRGRDSLLSEFAINTAKARSGDTGALDTLSKLSKEIESATKLTAASALDLNATRGWLAASLADTLTSLKLDLPKFAVGTNYVPRTMAAVIHEGEAIVPKAYNPWASGGAPQQSNARLEALVTQLIEDNRTQAGEIARLQARVARVVEKWDGDGLPSEREEASV